MPQVAAVSSRSDTLPSSWQKINISPLQVEGEATYSARTVPIAAKVGKDAIRIDMEIKFPQKEPTAPKKHEQKKIGSEFSRIFGEAEKKFPEPEYFQNIDCTGIPGFLTPKESRRIIELAEAAGFSPHQPHRMMNMWWTDIVDAFFASAIWELCGLRYFLRHVKIDGMVPCGLNDVVRIQKYPVGGYFGRHTDQQVARSEGKVSKLSLRVFLNSSLEGDFEGGLSAFHMAFRQEPVVFEAETGLALLYPQGEMCTVQDEAMVTAGTKYVLRADVLFCKPGS